MSYYSLVEFFSDLNQADSDSKRIEMMRKATVWQTAYLYEAFADWDWMNLPEGVPPYKPLDGHRDLAYNKLCTPYVVRQLPKFRKDILSRLKRETQFIQLLEGLSVEEAELLCLIKDKNTESVYPNVTRQVAFEALPDLFTMTPENTNAKE